MRAIVLREHVAARRAGDTADVRADRFADDVADDHPRERAARFLERVALGVDLHLCRAAVERVRVAGAGDEAIVPERDLTRSALSGLDDVRDVAGDARV